MKKSKDKVLNNNFEIKIFKEQYQIDDINNQFKEQIKEDLTLCPSFYKRFLNNEVEITHTRKYKAFYYVEALTEDAKYTYIKETKNEFNELVFKNNFSKVTHKSSLFCNELFKDALLYNQNLLYETFDFDGVINEEDIIDNNKTLKKFIEEFDYKLVLEIYDKLYDEHQIVENDKIEKVILDPITNLIYLKRALYLEPIVEISFVFFQNKKLQKYNNYFSLVTAKEKKEKSLPLDEEYKDFYKRNKPNFLLSIKMSKEEINYYVKEKYALSLVVDEEFNKLTPQETISRANLYLEDNKIKEGLLYIKKAFYLYNYKKVDKAFLLLAKEYLSKELFDYPKAIYYLTLSSNNSMANYLLAKLYLNGYIRGVSYIPDGLYYLKLAAKDKEINSLKELYNHYSSYRYLDSRLQTKYLKMINKINNIHK